MTRVPVLSVALVFSLSAIACGGDESGSGGSGATASASTTSGAGGSGGEAGTGGAGGGMGTGGMGTGGEGGVNPNLINGCDPATAEDLTGDDVDIAFDGFYYEPACVTATLGKQIRITGDFATYPIQGGTVVAGVATPDATSPIYSQPSDPFIVPYFQQVGTYPYYCATEYQQGMMGVIFLVP